MDAIHNFDPAWRQVTLKNLKGVWQPLLQRPNLVNEPPVEEIVDEIVNLGQKIVVELKKDDVKESLSFDDRNLSDEDLLEIDQARAYNEDDEAVAENVTEIPQNITSEQIGMIISKANELGDLVREVDPIPERQSKFLSGLQGLIKDYKDEQKNQAAKKRIQSSIGDFFSKKPKQ